MKRCVLWSGLLFCALVGCEEDAASSPQTSSAASGVRPGDGDEANDSESREESSGEGAEPEQQPAETPTEETPTAETQTEEPAADTPDECPLAVLDANPPLRVRSGPSSDSAASGELDNGTLVRSVERRDGYVRITAPVAGWVYERMLIRTCDAAPALPALPLGPRTYLLMSHVTPPAPGTPLPGPVTVEPELLPMRFSFRDARRLATPLPVTLVSTSGACETAGIRRVLLVGTCSDMEDYTEAYEAIEVRSCPELYPSEPPGLALTLTGLLGHHADAREEEWPHSEVPITAGQRRAVDRRVQRYLARYPFMTDAPEIPDTIKRFEDSRWFWIESFLEEATLLFHGDTFMGRVDFTSDFPRRVRSGDRLLAGVGGSGEHGYGFYMFPNEARRGLVREFGFPSYSCGPN